jgi:hypothetical protein
MMLNYNVDAFSSGLLFLEASRALALTVTRQIPLTHEERYLGLL